MKARLAIASILGLAMFGCGSAEERAVAAESGNAEAPDTRAAEAPSAGATPELDADVAAAPPAPAEAELDLEIERRIREKLVAGSEPLSGYAQSIEVTAEQGIVTLRGPVENPREREVVLSIARSTEGVTQVDDRLEIAEH